jgi:hypothetical protein
VSKCPDEPLPPIRADHLARLAGIETRHLNRLVRAGVVERAGRGRFDPEKAIPSIVNYYRQGREGSGDAANEKLLLTVAQRKEIEQRTAIRARELVPLDSVSTAFDAAMVLVGAQLDGLGGRLASDMAVQSDPAICRKVIFDETRRIRAAAAAELEALTGHSEGSETAEAAEGDDRG